MKALRPWTGYEEDVLRAQYATTSTAEIAAALKRTASSTYQKALKLGLRKSAEFLAAVGREAMTADHPARASQFIKGQRAWNEGLEYQPGGRAAESQFRPGNRPQTWLPVGTQRLDKDGLLEVKVADRREKSDWVHVHRQVWIEANGPLPAGHIVVFRVGRRTSDLAAITPDAVEAITRAELMRRNTYHRYGPEIAKVYQLRGAINRQINKRMKEAADA
jgi:hypothetical protein